MNRIRPLFALLLLSAAGCADLDEADATPSQLALQLPAADAARVLDLVNDPGTDLDVLDVRVRLDVRAARRIVAFRAGADGAMPSSDDRYFADVAQLDAVPWVGDAAFRALQAYAAAHPAPAAESVERVAFRGWESEAVTWGVNHADAAALDGLLDARAARGLLAARPFANVTAMGRVAWVGGSALARLRGKAQAFWTAMRAGGNAPSCVDAFDDAVGPHLPDLLLTSESDRPLELVSFPGAGTSAPTAASLLALLHAPAGSTAETRSVDGFYVAFEPASATADPNAAATIEAAFAAQLTDVIYVAVHAPQGSPDTAQVQAYLVGRTPCGDLVGIHAIAIET